ncbi:A24 family peptidase [Aureimonas phyllosphaerae]|uniref:A24 family peptidase n=1 Tax=Aureimonas phyllosphaerae TaxID=1166078 RepID=UPI003A5C1AC5
MAMVLLLAFPLAMVAAAASDLASMTISNRLVVLLSAVFPLFAFAAGMPPGAIALHGAAGLAVLAITFGCFAAGWMGGGDAKLLAAASLWLGPTPLLLTFVVWTSIFGGALTLMFLLARTCLSPTTGRPAVDRLLEPSTGIPYGVAIGLAGLAITPALIASMTA